MGRPWWCKCNKLTLWAIGTTHYSQHLFDPWSVTHFGHGIFIYGCVRGVMKNYSKMCAIIITIIIETIWEIVENTPWVINGYRLSGDIDYCGDSIINSCGDLIVCTIGAILTSFFV